MRTVYQDHNLNRLHQGTARCVIAQLPVSYEEWDAPPFEAVNANIKAFTSTGMSLRYVTDGNYKAYVHIPITEDNMYYDKIVTITMISDDRQENYWNLFRYMQTIQSGSTQPAFPIWDTNNRVWGLDRQYRNRVTWIPFIDIVMSDDSYQRHQTIRFERCYPVDLSDLNMNFLSPEPVTFTITFIYSLQSIVRDLPPHPDSIPACVVSNPTQNAAATYQSVLPPEGIV